MTAPMPAPARTLAPVLFVSHGAPTFALEPGALGARLRELGAGLASLRAVLVVSPHWQTRGLEVTTTERPDTIHDFGGFPPELYRLAYPAPGAPQAALDAAARLREAGWQVAEDDRRGLDHGAWVPLMHLLPAAQVPVFQLSMPRSLDAARALDLGRALAPLRAKGIAILASGSMTHNLHEFRGGAARPEAYVARFTEWVRDAVQRHDFRSLADYRRVAPEAVRAHPTDEHFLPLLVAVGTCGDEERPELLDDEIRYGMLSMESYAWGTANGETPRPAPQRPAGT
ncbi:dioxygenase [Burkholderiaceae bacterium FT117]|uniref:DODA-type extradiol aromatic ring-opening family dioxygenase n=1 Tax=Zeimonas sediminis TaxID=2944268 RepID=UPI0023430794|nr:class III extradiol ring-cleavage dioxygenase [Zeimonas sediminis]MCM5571602.1 dioxygenase [Zeimonas sediminis]